MTAPMNNEQDKLIPRPQAARLLREMFPEAEAPAVAHACWRAFRDGREEFTLAELVEALRFYAPSGETVLSLKRDFRLKR